MESREIRKPAPGEFAFDISGGALCLDFANTVDNRPQEHPRELLRGYADLVAWSRQAGAVSPQQAGQLLRAAARRKAAAQGALRRARRLRESLYRIFSAAAGGRTVPEEDVAALNATAETALGQLRVRRQGRRFAWDWNEAGPGLERMLWPVVRSAGELLTSDELGRVRECAAETCGWIFLDRSKNGSRRWCNMKVCGNRAKARRFYRRRKTA
jgi:predicted RNA-binding Zn ribbon-like protein